MKKIISLLTQPFLMIWMYISHGWQGDDGLLSCRRVFQFAFGLSAIRLSMQENIGPIHYKIISLFCIMFLVIAGIMSVQQMLYFYRGHSIAAPDDEPEKKDEEPKG